MSLSQPNIKFKESGVLIEFDEAKSNIKECQEFKKWAVKEHNEIATDIQLQMKYYEKHAGQKKSGNTERKQEF
jgi:hypothetical protein